MRCFVHRDCEAVGICKSCAKGLCGACAVDLERGLACGGRCEDDVRLLVGLVEQGRRSVGASGYLFLVIGLVLLAASILVWRFDPFYMILGTICLAYGVFTVGRSRALAPTRRP